MIDGSKHPYEENIALTKKVVEYAHAHGVVVEGELGQLAGIEDDVNVSDEDASFTKPEQVYDFATRTGVDSLAIAIGTSSVSYTHLCRLHSVFQTKQIFWNIITIQAFSNTAVRPTKRCQTRFCMRWTSRCV